VPETHSGDIDRLYALPLEEFTHERDELAKRVRDEGDADAAAAVKALKKPAVAAWAPSTRFSGTARTRCAS
jgi:hypothetical protein